MKILIYIRKKNIFLISYKSLSLFVYIEHWLFNKWLKIDRDIVLSADYSCVFWPVNTNKCFVYLSRRQENAREWFLTMSYAYLRCHLFPFIWCFLGFYLLKHTSSYYIGKSNIELTIWRFFRVLSRLFIWLLRVGHKCIYIWTFVRAAVLVSLPLSCDLPFVRSLTLARTIKIDHFTAAGVTIYIYVYLSSPFFFFSFSLYDRLNLWRDGEWG